MTPQRSPNISGKNCFLTIFNFSGGRSLSCSCATVQEADLLLAQEEDLLLVQDPLLAQDDLLPAQEENKKWSPEKLKMVKKHFFPELSGDLWGVICYHHWYLRTSLEPQTKFFPK